MKKTAKALIIIIFCMAGGILLLVLCLHYEMNVKRTACDTSVSPDGKYKLTLFAVGEPGFPFGRASGSLLLEKGEKTVSKAGFVLMDDGKSISGGCWSVTWNQDYAKVILSGDEQFDEQVYLYFDGTVERRQLTDSR